MDQTKLHALRAYLQGQFTERDEVIEGLLTALVAQAHVLLIGPPGTAKSAIVVALARCLDGADYFQWLLTKFSTPEELFGPYDLAKLKSGAYERITAGKLPTAHVAYLDELFKANSAILNALLTLVNERVFYNGTRLEMAPLMTLIATSNEYPQEAELQAVFDRFLLRYEPGYVKEDAHFGAMLLRASAPVASPCITQAELAAWQQAAAQIRPDAAVVDAMVGLRTDLAQEGIVLSDRRWMQITHQLLPARAILAGRDHIVVEEDAEILVHALWDDPTQQGTVVSLVRKRLDPVAGRVTELVEDARDIANTATKAPDDQAPAVGMEAVKKLKKIRQEIQDCAAGVSAAKQTKIQQVDQTVGDLLKGVTLKCLGV